MSEYQFKLGMFLPELDLPAEEALGTARGMGAEYVWFSRLKDMAPVAEWSDSEVDRIGRLVEQHRLKWLVVSADNPFKDVHLTDLPLEGLAEHPLFQRHLKVLVRSMQIAQRLGVGAVYSHACAWPGEYTADKPTWPMRWLTRGGLIAETDLQKLTTALSVVADEAERHGVDVVLGMLPWHYTNTSTNFRQVAERVGSRRLRAMWGPCDATTSGEWDVATAGFRNIRPYLHSVHCKDIHIEDGLHRKIQYRPLGEGMVDYPTLLRQLTDHRCDVVLSVSTHFRPASGSRVEAMQINYANLRRLISQVQLHQAQV